jgi:hypothetical protein
MENYYLKLIIFYYTKKKNNLEIQFFTFAFYNLTLLKFEYDLH